jgi:gas vesicle protein
METVLLYGFIGALIGALVGAILGLLSYGDL